MDLWYANLSQIIYINFSKGVHMLLTAKHNADAECFVKASRYNKSISVTVYKTQTFFTVLFLSELLSHRCC